MFPILWYQIALLLWGLPEKKLYKPIITESNCTFLSFSVSRTSKPLSSVPYESSSC